MMKKDNIYKLMMYSTLLVCLICFAANSFTTFKKFFYGHTLVLTTVRTYDALPMPLITICTRQGFKSKYRDDTLSVETYNNVTFDPHNLIVNLFVYDPQWMTSLKVLADGRNISQDWIKTVISSPVRGRCMALQYTRKVSTSFKGFEFGLHLYKLESS